MRSSLFISVLLTSNALAAEVIKDWSWSVGDNYAWAATINKSGDIFGQYCYYDSGHCLYLIATNSACNEDSKYPILTNSPSGAFSNSLFCKTKVNREQYSYIVNNFDQIDEVVKEDAYLRFAIPMESGKFKTMTFSLLGSKKAILSMREYAEKNSIERNQNRMDNQFKDGFM